MLRASPLIGFKIAGETERLVTSLFADDTTIYLSKDDHFNDLQNVLDKWCRVSGAKFNVSKTIILPIGAKEYRNMVSRTRSLDGVHKFPADIHIAGEGEPVRILGSFVGNGVDQLSIWTSTNEKIESVLRQWDKSHPTQNGCRLIIGMEIGGHTQYLTRVQGMPKDVEQRLTRIISTFMWDGSNKPMVGLDTLHAPITQGGKKIMQLNS